MLGGEEMKKLNYIKSVILFISKHIKLNLLKINTIRYTSPL